MHKQIANLAATSRFLMSAIETDLRIGDSQSSQLFDHPGRNLRLFTTFSGHRKLAITRAIAASVSIGIGAVSERWVAALMDRTKVGIELRSTSQIPAFGARAFIDHLPIGCLRYIKS